MKYIQLTPYVHLLLQSMDRQKVEMETVLTSGGSWFENAQDRGKKHLLEHCVVARTKDMDFQQLKDYTFRENIYLNAFTSSLSMGFEASGHHSDFRKLVDLLLEVTFNPIFDQTDLDREKEIVLREISERRGDPNYKLHFDIQKEVYTPDSLENHEVLGESELVAATTLSDFSSLYGQSMQNSHLLISVSGGGIEEEYLTHKLQEYLLGTSEYVQMFNSNDKKKSVDFSPTSVLKDFKTKTIVNEFAHEHADLTIILDCPVSYENRPVLAVFQNLFLRYGGVLHDKLRDELGLVYGLYGTFQKDLQALSLSMSCEIQYIDTIVNETKLILSDFHKYFKTQKFEEFKGLLKKKEDIAADTLGTSVNHAANVLRTYGVLENYEEYSKKIDKTTSQDFEELYHQIEAGLENIRLVIVSKDQAIEKLILN